MTTVDVEPAYHAATPANHQRFPRPDGETYRGPEWPDEEVRRWARYYERERAASIAAANDRTEGTVAYCEYKLHFLLAEEARRKALAKRFKDDPRGPRWSHAGGKARSDLIAFAHELKARMPIDRFMVDVFGSDLRPSGHDHWMCRCVYGLHEDRNPSMSVYGGDDPHVFCHGCRHGGDVLDLVAFQLGTTTFTDVVRRLAEIAGVAGVVNDGRPS